MPRRIAAPRSSPAGDRRAGRARLGAAPAGCALAAAVFASSPSASADDVDSAAAAYDRGAAAFHRQSYAEAAVEFARADELAPNPVALTSALKASVLADDPALGMDLVERAQTRQGADIEAAAQKASGKFAGRAAKLSIRCADERPCAATVDAAPFPIGRPRWVRAGEHRIAINIEGSETKYTIVLEGEKMVEWRPPPPSVSTAPPQSSAPPNPGAPPPAPRPAPVAPVVQPAHFARESSASVPLPPSGGVSPVWFWLGAATAVVLGSGTIWSGVDTLNKHADWEHGDDSAEEPGRAAQTRTNVLIAVTGATALATAAVGIFAVRWPSRAPRPAAIAFTAGLSGISLRGRY